jgi:hypothetical protein
LDPLELTPATDQLADQLNFLVRMEFTNLYRYYSIRFYWMVGLTIISLFAFFLPDNNRNISLKGVLIIMIFIIWVAFFIFIIWLLFKYISRKRWAKKNLKELFLKKETFMFSFDSEHLHYSTNTNNTSIKWDAFKYFVEDKTSIYLLDEENPYKTLFYSCQELGLDNYNRLKEIASNKLIPLGKIYATK